MRGGSLNGLTLAAWLALAAPCGALAATLNVNSANDTPAASDHLCTLREALLNANGDSDTTDGDCAPGSGADVIELPAGHYVLTSRLDVFAPVTFHGAGAGLTSIDAQGLSGVMLIQASAVTVHIEGVTLTRGSTGGAIQNFGAALTLVGTTVSASSGAPGGAISNWSGSTTLQRSLIRDNLGPTTCTANSAGAISVVDGSLRIENSTVSGNKGRCQQGAGALLVGVNADSVVLDFTTLASNECLGTCAALVDAAAPETVVVKASVLSNAVATNANAENCSAALTSAGHNLASDASCELADPTDLAVADPLLLELRDNGGLPTHALLEGSPAIDAIPLEACTIDDDGDPETAEVPVTEDQRGQPRPADGDAGACDVGAYEGTYVNHPPHAVCHDVSIPTGVATCSAPASVAGASSDPDGDTITSAQLPLGPFAPGVTPVTLTVTDQFQATDSCEATVTVTDTRPPVISCPTTPASGKKGLPHNFGVPATDNCGAPGFSVRNVDCFTIKKGKKGLPDTHIPQLCTIVSDLTGVHVTVVPKKKSHLKWTVDALDVNGNTASRDCESIVK